MATGQQDKDNRHHESGHSAANLSEREVTKG